MMNMNTLVRTTTFGHLSRRFDGYEHLEKTTGGKDSGRKDTGGWRVLSSRRTVAAFSPAKTPVHHQMRMTPFSYKRDRARRRHLFLQAQGYKLSMSTPNRGKPTKSRIKLKKAVVKVRRMVVSVLSFMRAASMKTCSSKSAIAASSPSPVHRCF